MLPFAWMRARTSMAWSVRPTLASQRGERGKNGMPHMRQKAGTN